MKRQVAGLAAVLTAMLIQTHSVPADACGVKLTIKTQGPKHSSGVKADVLLIGSKSGKLKGDLVASGHKVDTASDASEAKRSGYAVVITDESQASATRAAYPNSTVIVASNDPQADVRAADTRVARLPTNAKEQRVAINAREQRIPIATGPDKNATATHQVVAVGGGGPGTITPTKTKDTTPPPTDKTEKVAVVTPPPADKTIKADKPDKSDKTDKTEKIETTVAKVETPKKDKVEPAPKPAPVGSFAGEVHFGAGSYSIASIKGTLDKDAKWLEANPSVNVTIEGHADITGTPDANQTLSQARADAVKDYLVGKGIDASRLEVAAFGDTKPKYNGADGRNRRVMLVKKE